MPRKDGRKSLHVAVTPQDLEQVKALARQRGHKITADYLRELIERDAKALGVEFKFDLDRGGFRAGRPPNS